MEPFHTEAVTAVSLEEVKQFFRFNITKGIIKMWQIYFTNVFIFVILLGIVYYTQRDLPFILILAVGIALAECAMFLLLHYLPDMIYRMNQRKYQTPSRYVFLEEELLIYEDAQRAEHSSLPYPKIWWVYNVNDCFYIYQELETPYILPKAALPQNDAAQLADFLREKLGKKRYKALPGYRGLEKAC